MRSSLICWPKAFQLFFVLSFVCVLTKLSACVCLHKKLSHDFLIIYFVLMYIRFLIIFHDLFVRLFIVLRRIRLEMIFKNMTVKIIWNFQPNIYRILIYLTLWGLFRDMSLFITTQMMNLCHRYFIVIIIVFDQIDWSFVLFKKNILW